MAGMKLSKQIHEKNIFDFWIFAFIYDNTYRKMCWQCGFIGTKKLFPTFFAKTIDILRGGV